MSSDRPRNLKESALRGFAFVGGQTVLSKLITFVTQYVLSWLLLRADFGLVGLAYTVSAVAGVATQIGLREFIVRRQRSDAWIEPALWITLVVSLISTSLMCIAAPLAASLYHDQRVEGLVLVLALGQPFSALNALLTAVLQKRLKFGQLATIGTLTTLLTAVLSIVLAMLGLGAYAFAAPVSLLAIVQFIALWRLCGHRMRWRPRPRVWRYFTSTGAYVLLTSILFVLVAQGDYVMMGMFHPAAAVGLYFFAFSFAVQINRFLWSGFSGVLFPLMSSIQQDVGRLARGFQRTVGTIAVVIVPLCVLQAALAEPIVHLFFAVKWAPAIPAIQLMSIGVGLHTIAEPCVPLLQAQGRFRDLSRYTAVWLVLFLPCIYFAARYGDVSTVAGAVAVFYAIGSPIYFFFVVRTLGLNFRNVVAIYLPSASASLISAAVAHSLCSALNIAPAVSLLVIPAVFLLCYAVLIASLARNMAHEAATLIRSQLNRVWLARIAKRSA